MAESALRGVGESLRFGIACRDILRALRHGQISMQTLPLEGHLYFLHSEDHRQPRVIVEGVGSVPQARSWGIQVVAALLLLLILLVAFFDIFTHPALTVSVLYIIPVGLFGRLGRKDLTIAASLLAVALTTLDLWALPRPWDSIVLGNRSLALVAILAQTACSLRSQKIEQVMQALQARYAEGAEKEG